MDKHFPEEVVRKLLPFLLLDRHRKVTMLTVFHDDADSPLSDKGVIIAYDKMTVDLSHDLDFLHGVKRGRLRQDTNINLFDDIGLILSDLTRFIGILDRGLHIDAKLLLLDAVLFEELGTIQNDAFILCWWEDRGAEGLNFVDNTITTLTKLANLFKYAPVTLDRRQLVGLDHALFEVALGFFETGRLASIEGHLLDILDDDAFFLLDFDLRRDIFLLFVYQIAINIINLLLLLLLLILFNLIFKYLHLSELNDISSGKCLHRP